MTQSARLLKFDRCLTVGYSQWITATILGLSHGGNDAQKAMGLVAFGVLPEFSVPTWVAPVSTTQVRASSIIGAGAAERRKKVC